MKCDDVRQFFDQPSVVEHYARAANRVGLWSSEEKLFKQYFRKDDSILELGCGAGRIAIGLWELGFRFVLGTDLSPEMIREARHINLVQDYGVAFKTANAMELPFEDAQFDAAVFGFNGLMQIPLRENRRKALEEIRRVLEPGAYFIFTTHDRDAPRNQRYWKDERERWLKGQQHPSLIEFGDIFWETPEGGGMFIHSPTQEEVHEDIMAAGFEHVRDVLRQSLGPEPEHVREFSDECRFWVVRRPASTG